MKRQNTIRTVLFMTFGDILTLKDISFILTIDEECLYENFSLKTYHFIFIHRFIQFNITSFTFVMMRSGMIHLCNSEEKKERERERIMSVINSADKVTKSDFQSLIDQLIYLISKLLIIKLMFSPEHYFSFSSTCFPFKDNDLTQLQPVTTYLMFV